MVRPIRDPSQPCRTAPAARSCFGGKRASKRTARATALNGKHAARILDVGPSLVRAQALADPVPVARAIVSAKLTASAESVPAIDKRTWSLRLDEARSVAEIVTIEARIAAAYWRAFRDLGLRERKGGDLLRLSGSGSPTGKRALNFSARSTPRIRSTPCSTTPMWSKRGGWREL